MFASEPTIMSKIRFFISFPCRLISDQLEFSRGNVTSDSGIPGLKTDRVVTDKNKILEKDWEIFCLDIRRPRFRPHGTDG